MADLTPAQDTPSDVDWVNHPPHYSTYPKGYYVECINYTRHMMFSQGNGFKYVYRAGSKVNLEEDLSKAAWYLRDAYEHGILEDFSEHSKMPRVDPNATYRSRVGWLILNGRVLDAVTELEKHGTDLDDDVRDKDILPV